MKQHAQSFFLKRFFKLLVENNEKYCVLRNHEDLPNSLSGSDLDIAVLPGRGETVINLATKAAKDCGGFPIISYVGSLHIVRFLGKNTDSIWGVALDVFEDISYKGISYLNAQKLIENRFDYNGICVANSNDSLSLALLKELLSNGKDRKGYLASVIERKKEDEKIFGFLDEPIAVLLNELCSEDRATSEIHACSVSLRKAVLRGNGLKGISKRGKNLYYRLKRVFRPAGFSIGFLGTDGSGKTTLINELTPLIEEAIHGSVHYEHMRPNWLSSLGATVANKKVIENKVNADPHGAKESNFVSSIIRLAYYSIDYTIGYWVKIYPKLVTKPVVFIFDRYYYDFIYDPKRMKISLPKWILKGAFIMAPKPNIIFCLTGDPQVIFNRKPETNLAVVTAHVSYLDELSKKSSFSRIDTSKSLEDSIDSSLKAFEQIISNRK